MTPWALAVDPAGTVYVTDFERDPDGPPGLGITRWARVSTLAAGAGAPVQLSIAGLSAPYGVAVDGARGVYVADNTFDRVIRLPAGTTAPVPGPPLGQGRNPAGVAVAGDGTVYVSYQPGLFNGSAKGGVLQMAERARRFFKPRHTELPFQLRFPGGIALDPRGGIYVVDNPTVSCWQPERPPRPRCRLPAWTGRPTSRWTAGARSTSPTLPTAVGC